MAHTVHPPRGSGRVRHHELRGQRRALPGLRAPRSRAAGLIGALVAAFVVSACVPPTTGPGGPDQTTTTTTSGPGGACARDTSLPQPGDVSVDLRITGKVVLPSGQPAHDVGGFALVKDRRSNVGAHLAEASVNDAGFFLLTARQNAVPADTTCRDYWIEICAPGSNSCEGVATLRAELDVTGLVNEAAGQGRQDVDISGDPLVYEIVE